MYNHITIHAVQSSVFKIYMYYNYKQFTSFFCMLHVHCLLQINFDFSW